MRGRSLAFRANFGPLNLTKARNFLGLVFGPLSKQLLDTFWSTFGYLLDAKIGPRGAEMRAKEPCRAPSQVKGGRLKTSTRWPLSRLPGLSDGPVGCPDDLPDPQNVPRDLTEKVEPILAAFGIPFGIPLGIPVAMPFLGSL